MLIDTHAHIYLENFDQDLDEVVEKSRNADIKKIYMPNIDQSSIQRMLSVEEKYPEVCMPLMGLHPCSVKDDFEEELKIVESWLSKRNFVGIGETGLDLYWDKSYYKQQVEALIIQINWAKNYQLPIILHCRDSIQETINIIEKEKDKNLHGVFHCFTGTLEQAKQIVSLGFILGIGGVLTFKNSNLNEIIENISLEYLVLETDSPYLAPMPYRGRRNEPSYLTFIADRIADFKGISKSEVERITTENALTLFKDGD